MKDLRLRYTATDRNRDPICEVLQTILPAAGIVLEIASGSGEHVVHFGRQFPALPFQPSDPDPKALQSIAAWIAHENAANVLAPLLVDASATNWPVSAADAILCINMVHISPWAATLGLFAHAAALIPSGAPLYLYGPYRRAGIETAPSNEAFDADLKRRNPEWGLRLLEDVAEVARRNGFGPPDVVEMPANNLSVVFRRL